MFDNCRECGGTGVIESVVSGANTGKGNVGKATPDQKHDCPTCHGLGRVRRISYR